MSNVKRTSRNKAREALKGKGKPMKRKNKAVYLGQKYGGLGFMRGKKK